MRGLAPWKPSEDRLERGLWWDRAWQLVNGCTPVAGSPACKNCWAHALAHMRSHQTNETIRSRVEGLTTKTGWTGLIRVDEARIALPASTRKPQTWSIWNDLFHPDVSIGFIFRVLKAMAECRVHSYMVLTKRAARMGECVSQCLPEAFKNVRFGVTIENQATFVDRIYPINRIGAYGFNTFLSCEPLLGQLHVGGMLEHIDLVIAGGESGPKARPMHPDWARGLRDTCARSGTEFMLKQFGEWGCVPDDHPDVQFVNLDGTLGHRGPPCPARMAKLGKKNAGRLLDGVEHMGWPEKWRIA